MAPIAISFLAFVLALVGILLGSVMQRMLPEGHLSSDSKEVVKLSMGVVATLAALVLGLLVASAKSTYDARESEINQITAYVILIDNLLAKYGEEGQAARASLRQAIPRMVDRIWREGQSAPLQSTPFKASAEGEAFYQGVQELQPSSDIQRGLKDRVIQATTDLAQAPALFASWQLDTRSLFGSPAALDDNLVRWLLSYGACQRDHFGVACHLCPFGLRGDLPYSGTRPTVLGHHGDPKRTSQKCFARSRPLDGSQRCRNVGYGSAADILPATGLGPLGAISGHQVAIGLPLNSMRRK
jgi:hypothetical protein